MLVATACVALGGHASAQTVRLAPPALLSSFDVHAGTLQQLDVLRDASGAASLQLWIDGVRHRVTLTPHDVRSEDFTLLEQTAQGLIEHPRPPCVTYRGEVVGAPGARVAATLVDGTVEALIHFPGTAGADAASTWAVQPVRQVQPAASRALHLVYRAQDTSPIGAVCGVTTSVPATPAVGVPDSSVLCEIAIEADVVYYQNNGSSVTQTQNAITSVMNQVDLIFDRDCSVTYSVTTVLVTTTNIYSATSANPLLTQFQVQWNSVHGGIQRDVAHLFTGRPLTGAIYGLAYVGVVCNLPSAYGLSKTNFSSNFNNRVALTCHELGHNFSANHCNSAPSCNIMCSNIGGCSGNTTAFTPAPASAITNYAFSAPCLQLQPTVPAITSFSPTAVSVFEPAQVQLQGSGFFGATAYTVAGQTYTSGFAVSGDTAMNIDMPESTSLAPVDVSVTTPQGTSNVVQVGYTVTQPPRLRTTIWIPPGGGTASLEFAGTPGNAWLFLLDLSSVTAPFFGYNLLANPVVLTVGTFQAPVGREQLSVPIPPGLGPVTIFSQLLEGSPAGAVSGVSNLSLTILQ